MLEAEHDWLDDLAEAVADGQAIDWAVLESSAGDDRRRELIRRLRAIAAIGLAHADLTVTDTASDSISVRSQLPGFDDPSDPTHWGPLRILERVGRGRFGDVYRAWDPSLDREVALKLLRRRDDSTGSDREVIEEGRLMARVRHENVVAIYGAQRIDGRTGLWMEFVDGKTLAAELKERGPFAAGEVAQIGVALCRALSAVHDAGMVHRDVKAQNALRDGRGRIVLGDFGTGYDLQDERISTMLVGTPAYLAPEIFSGAAPSVQSDLYSLGILLFHLATGSYPIVGRSLREIRAAHAEHKRTSLAAVRTDLPLELIATIERAIAHDPAERHGSAKALEADLASAIDARSTVNRRRWFPYVAAAVLITALVGLAIWGPSERMPRQRQAETQVPTKSAELAVAAPIPVPSQPAQTSSGDIASPPGEGTPDISYQAAAGVPAPARTFRQIAGSELPAPGVPSPDGRLFSFRDGNGELSLLDIASKKTRRITGPESGDPVGSVDRSGFSLDGSRITYLRRSSPVRPAEPTVNEIRTIPTTGGKSRLIWRAPDFRTTQMFHWAGDDDLILAAQQTPPLGRELMIISTATGAVIASHTLPHPPGKATLSADGRYVAYDFVDPVSGLSDIDLWIVGTSAAVPLIHDSAASDRSPMWTADGRYLLFVSSRSGSNGLWAQRFENGAPVGIPVGVDPVVQNAGLLGMTAAGSLFVARTIGARDVFVADIDPQTLTVTNAPRRPTSRSTGMTTSPAWSPDGQALAFARSEDSRTTIVVKSMADGVEKEFRPPLLAGVAKMQWEANGRSLLLRTTVSAKTGLYRFSLDTGDLAAVWLKPFLTHEALRLPGMVLTAQQSGPAPVITLVDIETGDERVVHRLAAGDVVINLVASNRGDRFVYLALSRAKRGPVVGIAELDNPANARDLLVGPVTGGAPASLLAWSPDDREIIVSRPLTETAQPLTDGFLFNRQTLWALDVATGDLRPISSQLAPISQAVISSSGRQLAIDAGAPHLEVWALDNTLSGLPR